jgi:DNA-binding CsgD family transcriptional regulator
MSNADSSFADWNLSVAEILASIDQGSDRFGKSLVEALRTLAPGSRGDVGTFGRGHLPRVLYTESQGLFPEEHAREYLNGLYLLDPYFIAFKQGLSGCITLREIAPPGFEKSVYFNRYYTAVGVADDLMHLVQLSEQSIYVSLTRPTESGRFTEAALARQKAAFPVISAALQGFVERLPDPQDGERRMLGARIEDAFASFGEGALSPREREVVDLLLHGHDTQSAANQLQIARDTVKLHRRHAYEKLRVSSQGELFYKFLEWLSR